MNGAQDIKLEVIKVLATSGGDSDGAGRIDIHIIRWNDRLPVLEKRQYIRDSKTQQVRPGKCKGLTADEVRVLVEKWPEIEAIFIEHDNEYVPEAKSDGTKKKKK